MKGRRIVAAAEAVGEVMPPKPNPVVNLALVAAECRRLNPSQAPIPTAALVFSSAVTDPAEIFTSPQYRQLLALAVIVVRRFCQDPSSDFKALMSLTNWTSPPHIGELIFMQTLLSDPSVRVDQQDLCLLFDRFPILFRDFALSRVYSDPASICLSPKPRGPYELATIRYLRESGCRDEWIHGILQSSYSYALNFFREAATHRGLSSAFARFLLSFPEYFTALYLIYPNHKDLEWFLKSLINDNEYIFFRSFFNIVDKLPEKIVQIIVCILKKEKIGEEGGYEQVVDPDAVPGLVRFAVTHGVYGLLSYVSQMHTVRNVLVEIGREDFESVVKTCKKFNAPPVRDAIVEILLGQPVSTWPPCVSQLFASSPEILTELVFANENIIVELITNKLMTSKGLISYFRYVRRGQMERRLDANLLNNQDLMNAVKEADLEVYVSLLSGQERNSFLVEMWYLLFCEPTRPFPSLDLLGQMVSHTDSQALRELFHEGLDSILENKQWITPLSSILELFRTFVEAIRARAGEGIDVENLVKVGKKVLVLYIENNYQTFVSNWSVFCQFIQLITGADWWDQLSIDCLPLSLKTQLLDCFCQHYEHPTRALRDQFFNFLIALAQNEKVLEAIAPQRRNVIARFMLDMCNNMEEFPGGEEFLYMTWFLFEFAKHPLRSRRLDERALQMFFALATEYRDLIRDLLDDHRRVAVKWCKGVLELPEEVLHGMIGHNREFLLLLVNGMAWAIAELSNDLSQNREFLEAFHRYLSLLSQLGWQFEMRRDFLKVLAENSVRESEVSEICAAILMFCQANFAAGFARAFSG